MLPNAQLCQKRQRLHIPISIIAQLSQKIKNKMQISWGLGWVAEEGIQDLWRFAFSVFFETVVQLARLVCANAFFFEIVVHLVTFISISFYISLYLFIYLYISISLYIYYLYIYMYISLSIYIYVFIYLCISVYISAYLSLSYKETERYREIWGDVERYINI